MPKISLQTKNVAQPCTLAQGLLHRVTNEKGKLFLLLHMMMMLSVLMMVMWLVFVIMLVMEMVTNDADLTSQLHSQSLRNYIYNMK